MSKSNQMATKELIVFDKPSLQNYFDLVKEFT